jgi:hypothetical protein
VLENEKRAVLVGIVNRGEGCARKNSMGIYARSLITLQNKSDLCTPRKETVRPQSQFPHLSLFERFMYFDHRSTYFPKVE